MHQGMNNPVTIVLQWIAIVLLLLLLLWQLSGCDTPSEPANPDAGVCYQVPDAGIDPCNPAISFADWDKFRRELRECVTVCCVVQVEVCPKED